MIAFTHPGKTGDLLYSVPCMKYLCEMHGENADVYTSALLANNLGPILKYQDYINDYFVCGKREDFWGGWGIQPSDMSQYVDGDKYSHVYQFGFRNYPGDQVHRFYMSELGMPGVSPPLLGVYKYPPLNETDYSELVDVDYVVIACRGDMDFYSTYMGLMDVLPIKAVQVGHPDEWFEHPNALNYTNTDWLYELSIISNAKGFVGPISSKGALAHNFDFPKVYVTHPGYGASIGQLPITPTTHLLMQEKQGNQIAPQTILDRLGL